jgi:hypothetical protein
MEISFIFHFMKKPQALCWITLLFWIVAFIGVSKSIPTAQADTTNCPNNICISVKTDPTTGEIVISGKKSITPKPRPPQSYTPRSTPPASAPIKPKPIVKFTGPVVVHRYYAPRKTKPKPKPKVKKPTNLADQLSQYLPNTGIKSAPFNNSVIRIPITFWSSSSNIFNSIVNILGATVSLHLTSTYHWDFGDGVTLVSGSAGNPYPNGNIFHTYLKPGVYPVKLTVEWNGNWIYGGVINVIPGGITQSYQTTMKVFQAPSTFVQ